MHAHTHNTHTCTNTHTQIGTHAHTTHTHTNTHTHTHVILSSYIQSEPLLNMEIADGTNENFSQLVLESGTRSLPLPAIRLLSKSEYTGCAELKGS